MENLYSLWEMIKQLSERLWKSLKFQQLFGIWLGVEVTDQSQQRLWWTRRQLSKFRCCKLALFSTLGFWNLPGMCFLAFILILGYPPPRAGGCLLLGSGVSDAIISVNFELQASQCSFHFFHYKFPDKNREGEKAVNKHYKQAILGHVSLHYLLKGRVLQWQKEGTRARQRLCPFSIAV